MFLNSVQLNFFCSIFLFIFHFFLKIFWIISKENFIKTGLKKYFLSTKFCKFLDKLLTFFGIVQNQLFSSGNLLFFNLNILGINIKKSVHFCEGLHIMAYSQRRTCRCRPPPPSEMTPSKSDWKWCAMFWIEWKW